MTHRVPMIVLLGPHGAGKTTLGTVLARRLHVPFEHEIGGELRSLALAQDPSRHALEPQEDFDAEVMRREFERDRGHGSPTLRVVETWHPGNLAYAARRSPEVARRYLEQLGDPLATGRFRVWVQPLTLEFQTALARLSEPGPDPQALLAFFRAVADDAVRFSVQLGFTVLPTLATDDTSPEHLADRVLQALIRFGWRVRHPLV